MRELSAFECLIGINRFKNDVFRSKCDVIVVDLFPNIAGSSDFAALKSSMLIGPSIETSPLVAFITLRPIFYLVLLTIYLQPMRHLIFLLYLATVLRFQLPLLL